MNRREFLMGLGAGAAILVTPKVVSAAERALGGHDRGTVIGRSPSGDIYTGNPFPIHGSLHYVSEIQPELDDAKILPFFLAEQSEVGRSYSGDFSASGGVDFEGAKYLPMMLRKKDAWLSAINLPYFPLSPTETRYDKKKNAFVESGADPRDSLAQSHLFKFHGREFWVARADPQFLAQCYVDPLDTDHNPSRKHKILYMIENLPGTQISVQNGLLRIILPEGDLNKQKIFVPTLVSDADIHNIKKRLPSPRFNAP